MRWILTDTVAELFDRKVLYIFGAMTLIGLLSIVGSASLDLKIQINLQEMNSALGNPVLKGINTFMYLLVFMAAMATAGLIPSMLIRGRADYYLSKPISRASLLLGKVLSIWLVYGTVMVVCVLIQFVAAGLMLDAFAWGIAQIIAINLLAFLIWLSITCFAGIATGSSGMAIMAAFLMWLVQRVLTLHDTLKQFVDSPAVTYAADTLYYVFPKTSQICDLTDQVISGAAHSWMPLYSSLIFAVALFFITIVIFNRKSY